MNRLPTETRIQILGMMVEGVSIRAISRLTGASKGGWRVGDRLWELKDIVAMIDAAQPALKKRGPYKKAQNPSAC